MYGLLCINGRTGKQELCEYYADENRVYDSFVCPEEAAVAAEQTNNLARKFGWESFYIVTTLPRDLSWPIEG